jgi:hypothetical protein
MMTRAFCRSHYSSCAPASAALLLLVFFFCYMVPVQLHHISNARTRSLSASAAAANNFFPLLTSLLFFTRGLSPGFNQGALGIHLRDLVKGQMQFLLIENYMVDLPWLLSACPDIKTAAKVWLVHGERGEEAEAGLRSAAAVAGLKGFVCWRPPLPIQWGTHHSKAFLIKYVTGGLAG